MIEPVRLSFDFYMMNICEQCRFWVPFERPNGNRKLGECRKNAPLLKEVPVRPTRPSAGSTYHPNQEPQWKPTEKEFKTKWPCTDHGSIACGDFRGDDTPEDMQARLQRQAAIGSPAPFAGNIPTFR